MGVFKDGSTVGGNIIWHAGNDGPGSTLDADTVDGQHASEFINASGDTMTGVLNLGNNNLTNAVIATSTQGQGQVLTPGFLYNELSNWVSRGGTLTETPTNITTAGVLENIYTPGRDGASTRNYTPDLAGANVVLEYTGLNLPVYSDGGGSRVYLISRAGNLPDGVKVEILDGNSVWQTIADDISANWSNQIYITSLISGLAIPHKGVRVTLTWDTSGGIFYLREIGYSHRNSPFGVNAYPTINLDTTITGLWNYTITPTVSGDTIWHEGNDGSGSGLDADTVDGQHASAFATSGHSHSFASALDELTDVTIASVTDNEVLAYNSGTSTWINQTAAEAGLAVSSHNHDATYVNVTGDTMTGNLIITGTASDHLFSARQTGDTTDRTYIAGDGTIYLGGSGTADPISYIVGWNDGGTRTITLSSQALSVGGSATFNNSLTVNTDTTLNNLHVQGEVTNYMLFSLASTGTTAIETKVSTDSFNRFNLYSTGEMWWGDGTGSFDLGLMRSAANTLSLATGDSLVIPGNLTVNGTTTISGYSPTGHTHTTTDVTNLFDATTPVSLTPDIAGATGSATAAARRDHVHNVPAAAPTTSLTASTSNIEGSATSFARSNHTHAITTGITPQNVRAGGTNTIGTSAGLARGDHVHASTVAAAVGLAPTSTNTEGAAISLARSDHTHQITGFLPLSGDTMTGDLILNANPTQALQAATKQYVDDFVSPAYSTTIGNGSATEIMVTHNLGTSDIVIQTQDLLQATPSNVYVPYEIVDANSITFYFYDAPDTDSIRVIIIAAEEYVGGTNVVTSDDITRIVKVTQAEYDALTPDGSTLYVVVG